MKTYNVETTKSIIVVEAANAAVTDSGALVFLSDTGGFIYAFNKDSWIQCWKVT